MFSEPQRTEYDLRFDFLGFPVRVHPFFWLLSLLLGMNTPGGSRGVMIFMAVVFVSIMVHELGHAFAIRYFGWNPRIVLHGFGGLAIYDPSSSFGRRGRKTGTEQILISLAGPLAGFALAALIVAILFATKHFLYFPMPLMSEPFVGDTTGTQLGQSPIGLLVFCLLEVNIFWGLLNLLPIYPLDGGQVSRELFVANSNDGTRNSLTLSFVVAAAMALLCFVAWGQQYMAFMFGYMAYMNYQQMNPYGGGFGSNRPW